MHIIKNSSYVGPRMPLERLAAFETLDQVAVLLREPINVLAVRKVFVVYDALQVELSLLQVEQFVAPCAWNG